MWSCLLEHGLEAPEVAVAGASAPYRWVGIARQDCSYEPEPATPRSVMEKYVSVSPYTGSTCVRRHMCGGVVVTR